MVLALLLIGCVVGKRWGEIVNRRSGVYNVAYNFEIGPVGSLVIQGI